MMAKRMRPAATLMSRSPTARANCWRKFVSTCPNKSRSIAALAHMSPYGTKRTWRSHSTMSANDPKRTYSLPAEHRLDSQNDLAPHVPRGHFIQGDCCLVQWERAANMWPQAAVVVPSEKLLNSWSH